MDGTRKEVSLLMDHRSNPLDQGSPRVSVSIHVIDGTGAESSRRSKVAELQATIREKDQRIADLESENQHLYETIIRIDVDPNDREYVKCSNCGRHKDYIDGRRSCPVCGECY